MEQQKIPVVTIHSQALAGYLMMKKFILIDMRIDLKNSDYNVFIFKDSPEIKGAMQKYSKDKSNIIQILNS